MIPFLLDVFLHSSYPLPKETPKHYLERTIGAEHPLYRIAACESSYTQYNDNGEVLISKTGDVGVMQINKFAHLEDSQKMGIDIFSLKGNLEFALYLYKMNGTKDWYMSENCWGKRLDSV